MTFRNRTDARSRLAEALDPYRGSGALVLGIPRGGAEVAYIAARALLLKFTILVVRKLPFPDNPEAGFGAVAEDGTVYLVPGASHGLPQDVVARIAREQRAEIVRRIDALRGGRSLPDIRGRHVILVDDGIAMGSTTQAALWCCRNRGAGTITVAAPVASPAARRSLDASADETVVLSSPPSFRAVAEAYETWYDVPDREVVAIMSEAQASGILANPD